MKVKMEKFIRFIGITVILFLLFFSCEDKLPVSDLLELDPVSMESDVAYDITMEYTDSAQKIMVLEAPMLKRVVIAPEKDVFPEGILVTFFKEGAKAYATLTSDYAERLPDEYLVVASDNVVFENIEGEKLETSELKWDERKGRIFTDRFAKLTRPNEIIYGYGFSANQDFTEIEFEKTTGKRPLPQLDGVIQ